MRINIWESNTFQTLLGFSDNYRVL